jgi:hypothetical protein
MANPTTSTGGTLPIHLQIAKAEAALAEMKKKQAKQRREQLKGLPAMVGLKTAADLILALAPMAKGVTVTKVEGAAPAATGGARSSISPEVKAAAIADLKAGNLSAAKIAEKHGVSVASVNNWKRAEGLTKGK